MTSGGFEGVLHPSYMQLVISEFLCLAMAFLNPWKTLLLLVNLETFFGKLG